METNHSINPIKTDKELVRFHKQLITKFITDHTKCDFRKKRLILSYYDHRINENNIRNYINAKLDIFLQALLTEKLELIKSYSTELTKA